MNARIASLLSRFDSPGCTLATCIALAGLVGCGSVEKEPGIGTGTTTEQVAGLPAPDDIVLARVNDEPLTLQQALDHFLSSHMGHGTLVQGEAAVRELAGRVVEKRVFLQEAEALGLTQDEQLLALAKEYRTKQAEIVFWKKELAPEKRAVTEEEVEAFYAKTDVIVRLSLIRVVARDLADRLRQQVVDGGDFSELAAQESIDDSKSFGGSLGWIKRGTLDATLEDAAFALAEPGDLTPVVAIANGFAFARLEERMVNENRPPREVMFPQIRNVLERQKEDMLRTAIETSLRDDAGVEVDEALLTKDAVLADTDPEGVMARSAGETLTLGAFREMLNLEAIRAADADRANEAIEGLVEQWTKERALRKRLKDAGYLDDPEVVRDTDGFRLNAIHQTLLDRYVYEDVDLKEEQIQAYYEEHKTEEFTQPAEVRLASIVLATEEEAKDVRAKLEAGEDFGTLARARSIDPTSRAHGGRIGWVKSGEILPAVEEAAFALEPGAISDPVETEVGWFVLQLLEKKAPAVVPYNIARQFAGRQVIKQLRKEAYTVWAKRLKDRADIEFYADGIQQAVAWLEEEAKKNEPPQDEVVPEGQQGPPKPAELIEAPVDHQEEGQ